VCSDELNWVIRITAMSRIKMKGPYVKYLVTAASIRSQQTLLVTPAVVVQIIFSTAKTIHISEIVTEIAVYGTEFQLIHLSIKH